MKFQVSPAPGRRRTIHRVKLATRVLNRKDAKALRNLPFQQARTLTLGTQIIEIRHAPKWMLVLGDSLAGDVVRALEWLGPDLAEQAVGKLAGRIDQDEWRVLLGIRHRLPAWMATAIQKAIAGIGAGSV